MQLWLPTSDSDIIWNVKHIIENLTEEILILAHYHSKNWTDPNPTTTLPLIVFPTYWGYLLGPSEPSFKLDQSCPFPNTTSNDSNCRYNSIPAQQSPRFRHKFLASSKGLQYCVNLDPEQKQRSTLESTVSNPERTVTFSTGSTWHHMAWIPLFGLEVEGILTWLLRKTPSLGSCLKLRTQCGGVANI